MLKITAIRGNGDYFLDLAKTDYYTKGGEPPGYWLGAGASNLGLKGHVQREGLKNLLQGFHPNNSATKLVQNAGDPNRHKGYELTFNSNKDFSVLMAAAPPWMKKEMQDCHDLGVRAGLTYMEEKGLFTRRGGQGSQTEHAKAIAAVFPHCTSRAEEPHFHSHVLLMNSVYREDGTTGTIYGKVIKDKAGNVIETENPILDHMKAAGAVMQLVEATEMRKRLGVELKRADNQFSYEIVGVSRDAVDFYSTRRKEIEEMMRMKGFESAEAAEIANFETRQPKDEIFRKELFNKWGYELETRFGLTEVKAQEFCNQLQVVHSNREEQIQAAIRNAQTELTEENSSFTEAELYAKTVNQLVHTGIEFEEIEHAINREIFEGDLVSLGVHKLQPFYSTKAILELEHSCSMQLSNSKSNISHAVSKTAVKKAVAAAEQSNGFKYGTEYLDAINYLTSGIASGQNIGATRCLIGDAGSGKTTLLGTVAHAFESDGYRVVGVAQGGNAADQLRKKAGIQSATLAKWLWEMDNPKSKDRTCRLDNKTLLMIDEAAMTETPGLHRLYKKAVGAGACVIVSYDDKQCQAIGHGGFASLAGRQSNAVRITDNFRQRSAEDKNLAELAARGDMLGAIKNLSGRGRLHVNSSKQKAIERLVEDWSDVGTRQADKCCTFVGTHEDRLQINKLCQDKRISSFKRFLGAGLENHEGQRLYCGDRVLFKENLLLIGQHQSLGSYVKDQFNAMLNKPPSSREKLENGQFGTILSVNPISNEIRVKMDDERVLSVPISINEDFNKHGSGNNNKLSGSSKRKVQISLGYATTTFSGQGSDFEHVFMLAGGRHQHRESSYVQMTRHKASLNMYTTELDSGRELAIKSLLHDARKQRAPDNELIEELESKLETACSTRGERIEDSLLCRRMSQSRLKEFALSKSLDLATGDDNRLTPNTTDEQEKSIGHSR